MHNTKRFSLIVTILLLVFKVCGALSIRDCQDLALEHNLGIKAQQELLESADNEQKSAFADFLPALNAIGDYTYLSDQVVIDVEDKFLDLMNGVSDFSAYLNEAHAGDPNWEAGLYDPENSPFYNLLNEMYDAGLLDESLKQDLGDQNNWLFSLNVTQPLFTGGKILEKYRISKYNMEISQSELEKKKQEVLFETMKRYWLVIELESKQELAEKYLETLNLYESDVENYLKEGIVTSNELLTVQVKKNEAELNLLKVKNGIALSRMALNQIIGYELNKQIELSQSFPEEVQYQKNQDLLARALEQRPELQILSSGVDITNSLEKIAKSRYLPNVILSGNYNYLNPNPLNNLEVEFGDNWTVSVTAQWELFKWNQRGFSTKAARHRKAAIQKKYQEAEELITLQLAQAQYQMTEAVERVGMCNRNLNAAEENLRLTEDRFTEGLIKNAEVLEAQTLWYEAGSEQIAARAEYVLQQATVQKAAGELK